MQRWETHFNTKGFTLIELLVVISIIGLLASVVFASLSSARQKAQDASRLATLQEIQKALELYNLQNNAYPISLSGGSWGSQCVGWGTLAANSVIPGLVPTYMASMPQDPTMRTSVNENCIIYRSNGTDYKVLDYNLTNTSNMSQTSMKPFIDPARNIGQSWASSACPGNTETTPTLAVWTPGAMCTY
jgi:type II secretion system protein G